MKIHRFMKSSCFYLGGWGLGEPRSPRIQILQGQTWALIHFDGKKLKTLAITP